MKPRILVDLDEVLVDWCSGASRAWGANPAAVRAAWPPGLWDIVPPLNSVLGTALTHDDFWDRLHKGGDGFWWSLEKTAWHAEMLQLVAPYEWLIVTSPSRHPSSYSGKVRWLKTEFGTAFDQFVITGHKHLLANPHTILIDDREETCRKFEAAGGHAIVFPHLVNSRHEYKDRPVEVVRETLRRKLELIG